MNILYVTVVLAFTFTLIANLENVMFGNQKAKKRLEKKSAEFMLSKELAEILVTSMDIRKTNTNCPPNRRLHNLGGGQQACWPSISGGNCFDIKTKVLFSTGVGTRLCFTSQPEMVNQSNSDWFKYLAHNISKTPSVQGFCMLVGCDNKAKASVDQNVINNANPTNYATYNGLAARQNPPMGGPANGVGFTSYPVEAGANNADTNFINCGRAHTECFAIKLCLNGQATCTNADYLQQAFAIRKF